jgi:hypothetical protein
MAPLLSATEVSAQTPWEEYVNLPRPENALKVQSASYSDSSGGPDRLFEDLELLDVQIAAGDREAIRLALRLTSESDGHYAETLGIMLGRLVRINPQLFLEEFQSQRDKIARSEGVLASALGNYGMAYVDRLQAKEYETERRIHALKRVTDPDLRPLRDRCVNILEAHLAQLRRRQGG